LLIKQVFSSGCSINQKDLSDRELYSEEAVRVIETTNGIEIIEDSVSQIIIEEDRVKGIKTFSGDEIVGEAVILS